MARQDTKLESEGAEFMVLGQLLIEGIHCFKAYTNFAGYDLVAVNPETRKSARIQVKSRWATDYDHSFPIKNFDCDFVVLVALNRGYRFGKAKSESPEDGRKPPQFYCFPIEVVSSAQNKTDKWGKVHIRKISKLESYESAWHLVSQFLRKMTPDAF
jgi:hypothetical protein